MAEAEALFVNFNQDATSLAVGMRSGYCLYSLANMDEPHKIHESDVEDVCLIERLFSSSLVTLVSLKATRKLRVCHFQKGTEICSRSYTNAILAVRLNRLRVVVCLEESVYIHNIRDMNVLHTIRDTPPNTRGLCDLSVADVSLVAYPGSSQVGEVQVFDAANLQAVATISAHDSPLAAIKFNADGSKLATASEKGTVIRVFGVPSGDRQFEFRRGMKRCVSIYSLAFSADSAFLCASSNTETIHIFKLDAHDSAAPVARAEEDAAGWMGYVSRTAATYLPAQMSDMLQQERAFASAHLPQPGARTALALVSSKQHVRLLVAAADGFLYVYAVDRVDGGECDLIKQHRFIGSAVEQFSAPATAVAPADRTYATAAQKRHDSDKSTTEQPTGSDATTADAAATLNGLKLDDSREFPPMTHSAD